MVSAALLANVPQLCLMLLFAALHELGHLLLLLLFGGKPERLTLAFYGIGLRHTSCLNRWQEWLFLLGGIGVNGLLAALHIHPEINVPLLVINALPVYPLDMGRALSLYLPYAFCRVLSAVMWCGLVIAAVLLRNVSLGMLAGYILVFSLKEDLG